MEEKKVCVFTIAVDKDSIASVCQVVGMAVGQCAGQGVTISYRFDSDSDGNCLCVVSFSGEDEITLKRLKTEVYDQVFVYGTIGDPEINSK